MYRKQIAAAVRVEASSRDQPLELAAGGRKH
jgi:hypothetical protein